MALNDDEKPGLSRRAFVAAGLGVVALGACGDDAASDDGEGESGEGEAGESGEAESGDGESGDGDGDGDGACAATPADIEGPYYRPDIPIGGDLDLHDDEGIPLILGGVVMDGDCTPIEDAIVELWHASPRAPGEEPGELDATYDASDSYRYYGQVASDAEGRYSFTSLRPGWYLNGAQYRPAHLHLKVWVQGQERLTTQVYFDDDPFNDIDPWFNPEMSIAPDATGMAELDLVV